MHGLSYGLPTNNCVATGDLIKNQNGYAQYVEGFGWFGSLLFMNAGDGFMLHTANSGTFNYPENGAVTDQLETFIANRMIKKNISDDLTWTVDPLAYEYSSNITAVVSLDGSILNIENAVLGAFCNDECRGIAYPMQVQGQWIFFLTQYANMQNEIFNYKVYLIEGDLEEALQESLQFVNNQILGDPLNPFIFHEVITSLNVPENITLSIESGQVILCWDAVDGAARYHIYCCDTLDGEFEEISNQGIFNGTTWSASLPAASRKFYFITADSAHPAEDGNADATYDEPGLSKARGRRP